MLKVLDIRENILTQLHAQMGHSVTVLTTDRTFNSKI